MSMDVEVDSLQASYDNACELVETDINKAIEALRQIIMLDDTQEEAIRVRENAINTLGTLYVKQQDATSLSSLVTDLRSFFSVIPRARTAKIVRSIITNLEKIPDSDQIQLTLCRETIAWCTAEKRSFLRLRVQLRYCQLLFKQNNYQLALSEIGDILREVKRLDDKSLLVEVHLIEAKTHHAVRNIPKARAALTACRTAANSIYIGPELQADIDQQAGILAAEDKDFRTAFSYFYEAFEGLHSMNDPYTKVPLKYMMLAKILSDHPDDVFALALTKNALKYSGPNIEAMKAVASAYKERSLLKYEEALAQYKDEIVEDPFVSKHLRSLAEKLLERNLMRFIEPFSCVEIAHLAQLIGLPIERVEMKLSQMVLDKILVGTLDAGKGVLVIYDEQESDKAYECAMKVVGGLSTVVDALQKRAEKVR